MNQLNIFKMWLRRKSGTHTKLIEKCQDPGCGRKQGKSDLWGGHGAQTRAVISRPYKE
jgi:hypothetical protein